MDAKAPEDSVPHLAGVQLATLPHLPQLYPVQTLWDDRGCIGVLERGKQLPFAVKRFYFLTDVPEGTERGGHAHKSLWQCLIPLRGALTVELNNVTSSYVYRMTTYAQGLLIPPGWWRSLKDMSDDCLVGVLASEVYEEDDYIRDENIFNQWLNSKKCFVDIPFSPLYRYSDRAHSGFLHDDVLANIEKAIVSGVHIGGEFVEQFEVEFASFCRAAHAVGTANGLEAIQLALLAEGIGNGDEVIVPASTFIATLLAVMQCNATPILLDTEPDTGLMDVTQLSSAINCRTKAIIPVHLHGHPVDMAPLMNVASKNDLFVLEDAAQAHGASYKGVPCGSLGHVAAFSFYPTKNLGAYGDAGAITTSHASRAAKIRKLANYGSEKRYSHELLGINSRLDPLQAAVLLVKLRRLEAWNSRRRRAAELYLERLHGIEGLQLPTLRADTCPAWHVFAIQVKDDRRDELARFLRAAGIGTNIHYPVAIHNHPCFAECDWASRRLPSAEAFARETLSLPLDALHTDAELETVATAVRRFFSQGLR